VPGATRSTVPTAATAPGATDHDPLRRLQHELQPEPDPLGWLGVRRPGEVIITGLTVMCGRCAARRDWLVIRYRGHVHIRCRCGHQWHEPEITSSDFDSMIGPGRVAYDSLNEAIRDLGYDGILTGTWLPPQ
jgi:hypothetical protein